eukprot:superscaffoldBa00001948_g12625
MQQMASRPFATINVALETDEEPPDLIGGNVKSVPKPIALEPCFGNKAAVLSIFVRLPRGTGGIPPPGQSALGLAHIIPGNYFNPHYHYKVSFENFSICTESPKQ